jgi:hypothetical protein
LQYRDLVNGQWKQRTEHVPKNKVGALRARIKKAKQREREWRKIVKDFLATNPPWVKKCEAISNIGEVIPHLSVSQAVKIYSSLVKMSRSPCPHHCWGKDSHFCPYTIQLLLLQQQTQKQIETMLNL